MRKGGFHVDRRGVAMIEAVLSIALFALIATAFIGAILGGQESTVSSGSRTRGVFLAEEGLEAARNIRDDGFANLVAGTHGLDRSGGTWTISGSSDAIGGFTRRIVITDIDADRKRIASTVTWQQTLTRTGSATLTTRLAAWADGSEAAPPAWASAFEEASMDLNGNNDALKLDVSGDYAYAVRAAGQGGNVGDDFAVVDVSAPAAPSVAGSADIADEATNIAVSGPHAYVTTGANDAELIVVNVSVPAAPVQAGSFDATGAANGRGIAVDGTHAYLVRADSTADEFVVLDLTLPIAPTESGSLDLGAGAHELAVEGDYAYVASGHDGRELQVIDISTPSSPSLVTFLNLPGASDAQAVAFADDYLALGRVNGDLAIVDASDPSSLSLLGTYAAGGIVHDVDLNAAASLAFLATDNGHSEFQVVDLADKANPADIALVNIVGDLFGIAYDPPQDRAFAAGEANNAEFRVFSHD